jgi:hypothetical protein
VRLKTMKRSAIVLAATAMFIGVGGVAHASPPQDPFDSNDGVWGCFGDPGVELPPAHCVNAKSQGNTLVIKVFEPDPRWPQEGISFDPKSDTRPCPHDPDATDGTWWSPFEGAWVCHHRP